MFYVICPNCEELIEIPTNAVGTDRTDIWNVVRCDECDAGFDYDDADILTKPQPHN